MKIATMQKVDTIEIDKCNSNNQIKTAKTQIASMQMSHSCNAGYLIDTRQIF